MPQELIPALATAEFPGSQFQIWRAGGAYRVDLPALMAVQALGLGTAGQTLGMNAAGTALEWQGPYAAYTPTFTNWGIVTAIQMFWKKNGDSLFIRGDWISGTPAAGEARLSLPAGFTASASKITTIQSAGIALQSAVAANTYSALIESNVAYLTFGVQSSATSGMTKQNANAITVLSRLWSIQAEVPI